MYRTVSWIEVEDDLPERGSQVLAWSRDGENQVKNLMQECTYLAGDFLYGYHSNRMRGVTHWMYLPLPPEEDE